MALRRAELLAFRCVQAGCVDRETLGILAGGRALDCRLHLPIFWHCRSRASILTELDACPPVVRSLSPYPLPAATANTPPKGRGVGGPVKRGVSLSVPLCIGAIFPEYRCVLSTRFQRRGKVRHRQRLRYWRLPCWYSLCTVPRRTCGLEVFFHIPEYAPELSAADPPAQTTSRGPYSPAGPWPPVSVPLTHASVPSAHVSMHPVFPSVFAAVLSLASRAPSVGCGFATGLVAVGGAQAREGGAASGCSFYLRRGHLLT